MPLRYGSRVTGVIVISKLGIDQFDEDDVRLLEVLAGQASVALENARLYEQQRREAEGAKALLAFADEVSHAQTVEEICARTVETAASLFETERASLWLGERVRRRASGDAARRRRDVIGTARRGRRRSRGRRRARRARALDEDRERLLAVVHLPGVGRAPEGTALLEAARGGRDRERAARGEPRARDRRVARGRARAQRRGDRARARHRARRALDPGGGRAARSRRARVVRLHAASDDPRGRRGSRRRSRTSGSSATEPFVLEPARPRGDRGRRRDRRSRASSSRRCSSRATASAR